MSSLDWVLITGFGEFGDYDPICDTLEIAANVDIDSLKITWGGTLDYYAAMQQNDLEDGKLIVWGTKF